MKRYLLLVLMTLSLALSLSAMTLEEAVAAAKEHNNSLQSAREDIKMADATYYDVRGMLLPQVSASGQYQLSKTWLPESALPPKQNFSSMLDSTATDNDQILAGILSQTINNLRPASPVKTGSIAGQIRLNQILFSGGKLINGIHAVARYRSIQKLRYDLLERDVITQTTDLFYQTMLAGKVVDIQNQALEIANKHLQQVELFNREGQVSEFDLLRARLEVAKLRPQVVQAQNQYDLALSAFKKQIGLPDDNITLDGDFVMPDTLSVALEDAQHSAQKDRIELKLANIGTEINQIKYKAEKGNYLPNVALSAGLSLFTKAADYSIEGDDFGTMADVSVGFQIPLFTGWSNSSKRAYARHGWEQSRIQERDAQELINLEVKQAWQNLRYAIDNYEVQLDNIRLAERSLQLAEVRFANQVGIQLEVFDAQITLNSVQVGYYNAIYQVISANQKLKKAMGYNL